MKKILIGIFVFAVFWAQGQNWYSTDDFTEGMECTSVTVGKKASADGSVMTSHTDDSGRSRTNITVEKAADHPAGATETLYKRVWAKDEPGKMHRYANIPVGEIPQVAHTYQFLNTAYPCVNEKHQ